MEDSNDLETSPLTRQLYSIDWAVRFDEFRNYNESSHTELHELLANIEALVENEFSSDAGDLSDIKVLTSLHKNAKSGSPQWHYLSMLVHLKIILSAMPKGLTATATLSAIQIMEHMWKVIEKNQLETPKTAKSPQKTSQAKVSKAKSTPPENKATTKTPAKAEPKPAAKNTKQTDESAAKQNNNNNTAQTENVVIKKLATEAGLNDDQALESKCYEIASALADEYPEYTLTAIRVMTAEKLGVTRQFVENLDIMPARFKSG